MKLFERCAVGLSVLGGASFGLDGCFGYDLIDAVFGARGSLLPEMVYAMLVVTGAYELVQAGQTYLESRAAVRHADIDVQART